MDLNNMHPGEQMDAKADFYEARAKAGTIDGYLEYLEGANPAKYFPLEKRQGETLEAAAIRFLKNDLKQDPADFTFGVFGFRVSCSENPF